MVIRDEADSARSSDGNGSNRVVLDRCIARCGPWCCVLRTTSDVRATVHSFLSQAENLGEIIFGLVLAFIARSASFTFAVSGSAVLLAGACVAISRAHD